MNVFAIAALFAVTTFQMPAPHAAIPSVASRPAAVAQMRNPQVNFYALLARQMQEQPTPCRLFAFFGSDVDKPLETVYSARPGSPCASVPFYGFVFLTR
jgi:hypothetical protein